MNSATRVETHRRIRAPHGSVIPYRPLKKELEVLEVFDDLSTWRTTPRNLCDLDSQDLRRRLLAAGIPLDVEVAPNNSPSTKGLRLCQSGSVRNSIVKELGCGGTAFILNLRFENFGRCAIRRWEWELSFRWLASQVCWLEDHATPKKPDFPYMLYGARHPEFFREGVVNHVEYLGVNKVIDGQLLGTSIEHIPPQFKHGDQIDGNIALVDEVGRTLEADVVFRVDRSEKSYRRSPSTPRRPRIPIFDSRDSSDAEND
jgi:hypothetical protein